MADDQQSGSRVLNVIAILTGLTGLVTAVATAITSVQKFDTGADERNAGYAVLAKQFDDLAQEARADHDQLVALQSALAVVAVRAAASSGAPLPAGAPPPAAPATVAELGATLHRQALAAQPFRVGPVPKSLSEAVKVAPPRR